MSDFVHDKKNNIIKIIFKNVEYNYDSRIYLNKFDVLSQVLYAEVT